MSKVAPEIALIIPARNEELSLAGVLRNVPAMISRIVVVDNGSTDGTARIAAVYGATVVTEPVAGYGRASGFRRSGFRTISGVQGNRRSAGPFSAPSRQVAPFSG